MIEFRNIIINVENIRSISIFSEGRATRGKILNIFGPNLIKSYLWFQLLKLVSHRNLQLQIKLVKLLKVLIKKSGKKLYLWNMTRTKFKPSFSYYTNQITPVWRKGPPSTYFYKYQWMQMFQCMEICCTPLWKWELYDSICWY